MALRQAFLAARMRSKARKPHASMTWPWYVQLFLLLLTVRIMAWACNGH